MRMEEKKGKAREKSKTKKAKKRAKMELLLAGDWSPCVGINPTS